MYKHNRKSIRLKGYDYSQPGWYFITLCTKNRKILFGDVVDGKMVLNEWGEIAENEWQKTEEIRKHIIIDQYATMPNHLHGIIGIVEDEDIPGKGTMQSQTEVSEKVRANSNSPQRNTSQPPNLKSPSKTIGAIIRGYKSSVAKKINIQRNTLGAPVWQRNYYEHVIRDEPELNRIRKYIIENPAKWQDDKYYY